MDATFSGLGTPVDVLTARLVGWLALWAVAPHFFSRGALSGVVAPCGCLRRQVRCAAF